jgi:uncharacterized protein
MFTSIAITPEVRKEFGELPEWISVREVHSREKYKELLVDLDPGEASSIALALETPNSILVMDERKGRAIAKSLELRMLGTIKILVMAKQQGHITLLAPVLNDLMRHNFRISKIVLREALRLANEPEIL